MSPEETIEAQLEGLLVLNVRQIHLLQMLRPVRQTVEDLAKMSVARYGSVDSRHEHSTLHFTYHTLYVVRKQAHLLVESPLVSGCVLLMSHDPQRTKPYPQAYYRVYDYSGLITKEGLWWLKEDYRPKR